MKRILVMGFVLISLAVLAAGCGEKGSIEPSYKKYKGTLDRGVYKVIINETLYSNGTRDRFVHVDAVKESTVPYAYSGHDYNGDGEWERIFFSRHYQDGCNAMNYMVSPAEYEPCDAARNDKRIPPPNEEEQAAARVKLQQALDEICKPRFLVQDISIKPDGHIEKTVAKTR